MAARLLGNEWDWGQHVRLLRRAATPADTSSHITRTPYTVPATHHMTPLLALLHWVRYSLGWYLHHSPTPPHRTPPHTHAHTRCLPVQTPQVHTHTRIHTHLTHTHAPPHTHAHTTTRTCVRADEAATGTSHSPGVELVRACGGYVCVRGSVRVGRCMGRGGARAGRRQRQAVQSPHTLPSNPLEPSPNPPQTPPSHPVKPTHPNAPTHEQVPARRYVAVWHLRVPRSVAPAQLQRLPRVVHKQVVAGGGHLRARGRVGVCGRVYWGVGIVLGWCWGWGGWVAMWVGLGCRWVGGCCLLWWPHLPLVFASVVHRLSLSDAQQSRPTPTHPRSHTHPQSLTPSPPGPSTPLCASPCATWRRWQQQTAAPAQRL